MGHHSVVAFSVGFERGEVVVLSVGWGCALFFESATGGAGVGTVLSVAVTLQGIIKKSGGEEVTVL